MSSDLTAMHRRPGGLSLPDGLQRQLDAFRRTLWAIKAIEAVCGAVFGVLVAWLALFLLDRLGDTSTAVRWGLFAAAVGSCCVIPVVFHRWIWGRRGLDSLARLIARRYPSLGDQLLGIVEIVRSQGEQERSRSLCEAAIRQVAESAGRCDLREAVPRPRHRVWAWLAAVPLGLAVALSLCVPQAATNAWGRFLAPWRPMERFTFTRVDRLSETLVIPRGERTQLDVCLRADSRWRPDRARAWIGGGPPLAAGRDGDQYRIVLPPQVRDVPLQLAVGDARQRVRVVPMFRPEVASIEARLRLPSYLGREEPVTKDARGGVLTVVKGSEAVVTATVDRELASATVDGMPVPASNTSFSTPSVLVDESIDLTLEWQDTHGLSGGRPLVVRLAARDDAPPAITVDGVPDKAVLLETETIRFMLHARDDFGVRQVGVEWIGTGEEKGTDTPAARGSGERVLASGGPTVDSLDAVGTFSPTALAIAPQTVEVRAFAEDYLPGRGRSYSAPAVFVVMTSSDHALWINDQIARWRQQTAEVRDREMELLARNDELLELSAEQLDAPESRKAIREQAAAEKTNGRRLGRLADGGAELVRQALRNPEFDAATLERLAENVRDLKEMAETRMPGIGELLQAAAEASSGGQTPQPSSQETPEAVGERRGGRRVSPSGDGKKADSPFPPTPQVVDAEASPCRAEERTEEWKTADGSTKEDGSDGGGVSQLKLPTTTVGSVPQKGDGGSSGKRSQGKLLDEAVEKQRRLVEEFAKVARQLADVMARLEGTTFVKRLKAAARSELEVGEGLASIVSDSFGRPSKVDSLAGRVDAVARGNDDVGHKLSAVMDDLDAYSQRRPQPALRTVLEEMKELDVLGSLRQLTADMKRETGVSIAQTEFWSDTLDRWADELVPPPQEGGGNAGDGPAPESLPPDVVLETMQILEAETNLREETRVAEQVRPSLAADAFATRAEGLAAMQRELADRMAALVDRLRMADGATRFDDEIERMKRDILPGRDGRSKFTEEIRLLSQVQRVMGESAIILAGPDTGRRAIAAETEAIELLLQSQFGKEGDGGGGGGGGSPGGGAAGAIGQAVLARLGEGINRSARLEASDAEQAIGKSGVELPEEFRAGLDAYFNAFERIRDAAGAPR